MDCGGEPAGVGMTALTTSRGISMVHSPGECELQHYQGGSSVSFWFELQPHTPYLVTRILFLFDASRVVDISELHFRKIFVSVFWGNSVSLGCLRSCLGDCISSLKPLPAA